MSHELLKDAKFFAFLLMADLTAAEDVRCGGCPVCGGPLHVANFPRKPRGGPDGLEAEHDLRLSFCCGVCRRRATPRSLRFLGRRVYLGAFVVLVSTMLQGPTPARVARLREEFGVAERTLRRWMRWWAEVFPTSEIWRAGTAAFMPPVAASELPVALLGRFAGVAAERLRHVLSFLSPLSATRACSSMVK